MIEITASAHVPYQREHHENREQHCKGPLRDRHGRIRVKDPKRDRPVQIFLVCFMILELASMWIMEIDWAQVGEGISRDPHGILQTAAPGFQPVWHHPDRAV